MTRCMIAWLLPALCMAVGCGDSRRPVGGDASVGVDARVVADAATGNDGSVGGDGGGELCNGAVCSGSQICCQVSCEGERACTTAEGAGCPLLGCPPPPTTTECGAETCVRTTDICVSGAFGGPTSTACQPVPTGCETDRTCSCVAATYCTVGLAMCSDTGDNTIFCDTGLD